MQIQIMNAIMIGLAGLGMILLGIKQSQLTKSLQGGRKKKKTSKKK